jgi:BirA family transcriptional regulator, biotin operon repressor / biotin---[acetyl-CoA-carboxylase] ligase
MHEEITAALVTWDGHTAGALAHRCGVPHVEIFDVVGSTLDVAHELAESGAPSGTLVVADAQLEGRGRFGRAWSSEAGRGVWCTMLERPRDALGLDLLSIRVGIRLALALDVFAGAPVGVKWPNDLQIGDQKLGGVLVETRWQGDVPLWIAIGVGINVQPPTGVAGAAGLRPGTQRSDVLAAIVPAMRAAAAARGPLSAEKMRRLRERDTLLGHRITSPSKGVASGIDELGSLLVRDEAGNVTAHRGGTVVLAEDA